ncbi:Bacterial regulatory proteins, tetR family [Clostridium sp. C105KSO15]|nr:Bacterial regulatory proteins, tetR family [Clostridium sp. C105KSO15]
MNRTKKLISDTFWQLLEEKPYSKITVQNIVERCQVNRNTFYYHFQDIPTLANYSIKEWADNEIKANYEFGAPISCIIPIAQEFTKRKNAFIHIYRSSQQESFIQYLNEICFHVVQFYVSNVVGNESIAAEHIATIIRYYKCVSSGIILDWINSDVSYDLTDFCEKICASFAGAGKRAFLKHMEEKTTSNI